MDYTLFPPIVESKMPAFLKNTPCKVYFSLSSYNNISQIANCHVRVSYQNNNNSALKTSLYPSNIKICNLSIDNTIQGDAKYYITISPSDLQQNIFDISQYYKIQIRFTSIEATIINNGIGIDNWLANNLQYFSEWSQICLIKAISQPSIDMLNFGENNDYIQTIISNYYTVNFEGTVNFSDPNDTQHVRSFNVLTYQDNVLINTSDEIYTNPYNNINKIIYSTTVTLQFNKIYKFKFNITTNNFYTFSKTYTVMANNDNVIDSNLKIQIQPDELNGRMKIQIINLSDIKQYIGNIIIKRASGKKNFSDWTDIHIDFIEAQQFLNYIWYDSTIQSGQLYLYGVQQVFNKTKKSKVSTCQEPKLVVFQHMYLSSGGRQLNIKFDPQINSFQRIVSEARIETIGSKYPWFVKNGAVDYKTFTISGTISALMDDSLLMKSSREQLYGDRKQWYDDYNEKNRITPYNDYVYEKDFRQEVINFLYQDNIKLFRSATEGNIFVKLMDINFTPNTTLSRRIYSFSCTAYEADEFNLKNCLQKYNILELGEIKLKTSKIDMINQSIGQLYAPQDTFSFFGTSDLITTYIKNQNLSKQLPGYTLSIDHLSYLKIELSSKPYLIQLNNDSNPILGHEVYINNQLIIIGQNGIYELRSNDEEQLFITSLYFVSESEQGCIDYIASLNQQPIKQNESIDSLFAYYNTIGQLWGEFNYEESLYTKIYDKYYIKNSNLNTIDLNISNNENFGSYLKTIKKLKIIADPGSVFYVQNGMNAIKKYVIGESGILYFDNDDTDIKEIYFGGIHLNKALQGRNGVEPNEYIENNSLIETRQAAKSLIPTNNTVYFVTSAVLTEIFRPPAGIIGKNQRIIYYKNQWYIFNQNDILTQIKSTDIILDYYATIYKGRVE